MEGEYLYPGDSDKDWGWYFRLFLNKKNCENNKFKLLVCDCRPTYVYHPGSAKCHATYDQGRFLM